MKREKKKTGKNNSAKKIIIITSAILAVLLVLFLLLGMLMPKTTIANNVYAGRVNLEGMTLDEAVEALGDEGPFSGITVKIESNGYNTEFSSEEIALVADAEKTAQKAFDIGKSKNPFANSVDFFKVMFSKTDVGCVPSVDEAALDAILYSFGTTFNGEFTDYAVELGEDTAVISPRIGGQDPNTEEARNQILKSLENGIYSGIQVTLNKSDSTPITVDEIYEKIYAEPTEAEYVYEGEEILVKEHVVGVEVEKADLPDAVDLLNAGEKATVPVKITMPTNTTEGLKSKLFNTTLGSYSTTYSTSAANRASNIALAAKSINGKVLKPGDVFSYNETVGDTTIARGYKVAPTFANGKTSQGVGGGICQVSTTLYSAVLYADLKVVERRNHSLTVAYAPKGQDATVSYGAIDFKFKNDTEYPIKISATTSGGKLTVSIIGTKRDVERKVTIEHKTVSSTEPTTNETIDSSLAAGEREVTSSGKTGYVVDTYKTVTENGKTVSSGKITRSTYRMVPTEVSVGSGTAVTDTPADGTNPAIPQPQEGAVPPIQQPVEGITPQQPAQENIVPPVDGTPQGGTQSAEDVQDALAKAAAQSSASEL